MEHPRTHGLRVRVSPCHLLPGVILRWCMHRLQWETLMSIAVAGFSLPQGTVKALPVEYVPSTLPEAP